MTYAQLPDTVLLDTTLPVSARLVYALLDLRAGRRGWFYDSQADLARALGIGVRTLRRAVAALRARGLVDVDRHADDRAVMTYRVVARMAAAEIAVAAPEATHGRTTGQNGRTDQVSTDPPSDPPSGSLRDPIIRSQVPVQIPRALPTRAREASQRCPEHGDPSHRSVYVEDQWIHRLRENDWLRGARGDWCCWYESEYPALRAPGKPIPDMHYASAGVAAPARDPYRHQIARRYP